MFQAEEGRAWLLSKGKNFQVWSHLRCRIYIDTTRGHQHMKTTTSRSYRPKSHSERSKALTTITALLKLAHTTFLTSPRIAHRIAKRARRIAMKQKLRLPPEIKRKICKGCQQLLIPGKTCRIRTARGHVVIYCMGCKRITRIMYEKKHANGV